MPLPDVRAVPGAVTQPTVRAQPMPLPQVAPAPRPAVTLPAPDFDRPALRAEPTRPPGLVVQRRDPDGSRLIVAKPRVPDVGIPVSGYREREQPHDHSVWRLYPDGHRHIVGSDYDRQSWGGYDFVRYRDGLRAGYLPDGRLTFQDRTVMVSGKPMMERLRYVRWIDGRPHFGVRPQVYRYDWVPFGGVRVPCFRPDPWQEDWTRVIYAPVLLPMVWTQVITRNTWVRYSTPVLNYADPIALLGDLQISSAFQEGFGVVQPLDGAPVYEDIEVVQLRNELADLQMQLAPQPVTVPMQPAAPMPVLVSDAIRGQVYKQVRLAIAMQQNGHAMRLPDLLRSGYAGIYLFQVGQPSQVPNMTTGADCVLQTGDLLRFDAVPIDASQLARLRVEARGAGSCQAGQVVQVSPDELQSMLNGFAERVEDNVRRLAACRPGSPC